MAPQRRAGNSSFARRIIHHGRARAMAMTIRNRQLPRQGNDHENIFLM
jgi:hypothetical protein